MKASTLKITPRSNLQRTRLETVYRKAEYRVLLPQTVLTFQIGNYDTTAESTLLAQLRIRRDWAILTPCNPRSQEATEELNAFYHHELRDALAAKNSQWIAACNHDPQAIWPDEPGFLITDADPQWVRELGIRFRQNAYVAARLGEAPRLIWLG